MGGSGSGTSRNRLPAVATVSARGWGVGTVLTSPSWVAQKEIVAMEVRRVRLRNRGTGNHGSEFVKSFPIDVQHVDSSLEIAD